jgi:hypothetical protein
MADKTLNARHVLHKAFFEIFIPYLKVDKASLKLSLQNVFEFITRPIVQLGD